MAMLLKIAFWIVVVAAILAGVAGLGIDVVGQTLGRVSVQMIRVWAIIVGVSGVLVALDAFKIIKK